MDVGKTLCSSLVITVPIQKLKNVKKSNKNEEFNYVVCIKNSEIWYLLPVLLILAVIDVTLIHSITHFD